jgi:hypothetical protein
MHNAMYRALREAGELLAEAQELARQQTLADLMAAWTADSVTSDTTTAAAGAAAGASPPTQPLSQQQQIGVSPPAAAGRESSSGSDISSSSDTSSSTSDLEAAVAAAAAVTSDAALQAFWCEQGLSQSEAQQLMKEVARDEQLAAACRNTQVSLSSVL